MLKKYITYAKLNVFPKIHDADLDKISHVYAELRRESSVSQTLVFVLSIIFYAQTLEHWDPWKPVSKYSCNCILQHGQGVPIAVRHIESIIRMSEAHAKMHLRSYVSQEDVDMAIRVLLDSFISTQKFGVQKALQKVTSEVEVELLLVSLLNVLC